MKICCVADQGVLQAELARWLAKCCSVDSLSLDLHSALSWKKPNFNVTWILEFPRWLTAHRVWEMLWVLGQLRKGGTIISTANNCHVSSQTEAALHFFLQNVRLSWTFPSLSSLLPMLHAVLRSRDGPWCRQLPPNPGSAALPYLAKVVAHAHKQWEPPTGCRPHMFRVVFGETQKMWYIDILACRVSHHCVFLSSASYNNRQQQQQQEQAKHWLWMTRIVIGSAESCTCGWIPCCSIFRHNLSTFSRSPVHI